MKSKTKICILKYLAVAVFIATTVAAIYIDWVAALVLLCGMFISDILNLIRNFMEHKILRDAISEGIQEIKKNNQTMKEKNITIKEKIAAAMLAAEFKEDEGAIKVRVGEIPMATKDSKLKNKTKKSK